MSEQRLRDLGREAERLVDLPDLGSLQRRGRALRFRRQAGVVAAAAVVAATGVFLFQDRTHGGASSRPRRARSRPPSTRVGTMQDLAAGHLRDHAVLRTRAEPTVLLHRAEGLELVRHGPNRFAGHLRRRQHQRGVARTAAPGSVGLLVLKLTGAWRAERLPAGRSSRQTVPCHGLRRDGGCRCGGCPATERRSATPRGGHPFGYPATQVRATIDDAGRSAPSLTCGSSASDVEGRRRCALAHGHGHLGRRRRGHHARRGRRHHAVRVPTAGARTSSTTIVESVRVRAAAVICVAVRPAAPIAARRSSRSGARGCGTRPTSSCRPRGPRTSRRSTA